MLLGADRGRGEEQAGSRGSPGEKAGQVQASEGEEALRPRGVARAAARCARHRGGERQGP